MVIHLFHRGFAFIIFKEKESVEKVLEGGKHTLDNRDIDVKKAIPHAQHQVQSRSHSPCFGSKLRHTQSHAVKLVFVVFLLFQTTQAMKNRTKKIFVGGVPTDMEQITIESYFKEYGEVNS